MEPEGKPVNSVADAHIKTGLAEVPNTPAYRQQSQQQIAQIITALGTNPQAVAVLAPAYVESTSLNNRQQVADDLRRVSGLPMPGDKEGQAQAEQQQQKVLAEQQQHARALAAATLDEKVASAERYRAGARKSNADAELVERRIQEGEVPAQVDKTLAETAQLRAPEPEPDEDQLIEDALAEAGS